MKELYTFKDTELREYLIIKVNVESNLFLLNPIRRERRRNKTQTKTKDKFYRQDSPYFLILSNGSKSGAIQMVNRLKKKTLLYNNEIKKS